MDKLEIWKDAPEYEELYQVSNMGRVKTLPHNKNKYRKPIEIIHSGSLGGGYIGVSLCKNSNVKRFRVHRLVAELFIPNPQNKPQVNHINGIKTDNRVENLEWCTRSENMKHAYLNNLVNVATGFKCRSTKLSSENAVEIRRLYKDCGLTKTQIAKKFNVCADNITAIINRKTFKYV